MNTIGLESQLTATGIFCSYPGNDRWDYKLLLWDPAGSVSFGKIPFLFVPWLDSSGVPFGQAHHLVPNIVPK
jgi:hypothetical protein